MKIRQNFILAYLIPLILAVLFVITGISGKSVGAAIFGLIIAALCVVEWQTTTLEVNDGLIMGRCGLIKKRTLSSPMSKIQYCKYTTFLCFNKIRINCISGQFTYKNMKGAKQFVDLVQSNINN